MHTVDDSEYQLALGLATQLAAVHLTEAEADDDRRVRRQTVVSEKWALLRDTFRHNLHALQGYGGSGPSLRQLGDALADVVRAWRPAERTMLVIDRLEGDPFAPYEFRVDATAVRAAVTAIARVLGVPDERLAVAFAASGAAHRLHRPTRFRLLRGAAQAETSAVDRPALPVGVDPADTRPLALLGGGSLSVHGERFAGGLWLLDGPEPDLWELTVAQTRTELIKLAVSHEVIVIAGLRDATTTADVIGALVAVENLLEQQRERERQRNDDDARSLRDLDDTLRAVATHRAALGGHASQVA